MWLNGVTVALVYLLRAGAWSRGVYVQLLDHDTSIALLRGTAVEDFTWKVNQRVHNKAKRYHPVDLSAETALSMLL